VGQALLVYGSPQVLLFAADLHEDFIDKEGVTIAAVLSFQAAGIDSSEFDTPEADCFSTDGDAAPSEQIFDITMAEIKSVVEPDSIGNDVERESVAFVCIHLPILAISVS
jgi:hypothetical protein